MKIFILHIFYFIFLPRGEIRYKRGGHIEALASTANVLAAGGNEGYFTG
jgi:hypothetical protein